MYKSLVIVLILLSSILFIDRQTGSVSHPHPLNVIVLNMNALDTHKAASSVGSLDARTGELGWCPTVEALQCIYVLLVHLHYGSMLRDTTVQTNPDTSRSFDSDVIRISNSNSGSRRTNGIAELYTLVHNENVTMLLNHCCGKVTHPHPNSMDADDDVCNYNVEGDVELLRFIYSMWQPDFGMSNSTNTNSHTFDSNTFIEAISYGASMPISDLSASHASRMVTGSPVSSPISRGGIGFESNHLHSTNRAKGGPTGAVGWCGSEVQQKLQQPLYDMLRSLFFK